MPRSSWTARSRPYASDARAGSRGAFFLEVVAGEAVCKRLHDLGLHRGRLLEHVAERAVGDDEQAHGRPRDDRRRAGPGGHERDLAKEVAVAERAHLAAVPA